MEKILRSITEREEVLDRGITEAERDADRLPAGKLRVSTSRKQRRFYCVIEPPNEPAGKSANDRIVTYKYIPISETKLPRLLAQKDYGKQFLIAARRELDNLERVIALLLKDNADKAFESLSDCRKELVRPYILSDEDYAKVWQEQRIEALSFRQEEKKYDTNRGDRVRSKSEALLANLLFDLGIPYHYEKALKLQNGRVRYPDFTLLDVRQRKEIYWEHLGLIDDDMYRWENLEKINEYRRNGIYGLKNLIVTYESEQNPLDIAGIKSMLKEVFCNDN